VADPEQVAILRQGVKAWNEWRSREPLDLIPDLTGSDLSGVDLVDANLFSADLDGANLEGARLTEAKLHFAGLRGANLRRADLAGVNLTGATPVRADFGEATFFHTIFGDVDLSDTIGLESCHHHGPSIIDYGTLVQSRNLPLAFLRGCGLPDNFIESLPSLLNQPIQFYSCFISYSTKDQGFAERLYADLQNKGVRCWFAPHDARAGQYLDEQIDRAIQVHDRLLLILSEHSIHSEWVRREIVKARKRELAENRRVLFPVRLVDFTTLCGWNLFDGDEDLAQEIRRYLIPDFSTWKEHDSYQRGLKKLLGDLKSEGKLSAP
jgi:hypothetical protein